MSVLIKGMEMPKSCPCEIIGVGYDLFCSFAYGVPARVQEYNECCENGTKPDWCPLIEVPPHGRLIDADALWVEINKICDRRDAGIISDLTCIQQLLSAVRHTPTVIPADAVLNIKEN